MKKTFLITSIFFACGFASHADMVKEKEQQATITQEGDEDVIYSKVMKKAEFKGGQKALMEFLRNNLKYPKKALDIDIQGRVLVKVVITQEGKVRDPEIIRSVDPLLDEEALRVVGKMPDWIPAEIDGGKKVNSYYTLPITFKLVDSPSKTKPKKR